MTFKALKNSTLLQLLLLVVTVLTFTACAEDEDGRFFFDVEAQKVKDEQVIRQYFRDNDVDTTAVERTASGLYYLEVTEGTGDQIKLGDRVSVHYIGTYTNKLKFDSSYDRGNSFVFTVRDGEVIDGWVEGIQKMRVGGEGLLYIPSHLAYGPFSQNVPPNSVLIFDIEVLRKL